MKSALQRYKLLVAKLRVARMRRDETGEEQVEESMLLLWGDLSEEDRRATESFAWEAFPELYCMPQAPGEVRMSMKAGKTGRGFGIVSFEDANAEECTLQESSAARDDESLIWLGVENAKPQILSSLVRAGGTGWEPVPFPEDTMFTTRMHLSQSQVAELLPLLQHFVDTGRLPEQLDNEPEPHA